MGVTRQLEMFQGDVLDYKLKGEFGFRQNKISAFNDTAIFFSDGESVLLSRLRCVRINNSNHLTEAFTHVFKAAGVLFIILDTVNNILLERPKVVNEKAVLISAGLIAAGYFVQRMGIKKVRIRKNTVFKVVEMNYRNLNGKS